MDSDDDFSSLGKSDSDNDGLDQNAVIGGESSSRRTRSNGNSGLVSDLKDANGYSWEDEYQRSWDIVKDDDGGNRPLESIIQGMIENRKKKIMKNSTAPFQRGIIRTMILIIDGSLAMLEKDLRPTRFAVTLNLVQEFIAEFFDQNPISQLGILMMRNGIANVVSDVSGLPQYHIDKIRQLKTRMHNRNEPKGDPSLQNSLELARAMLKQNFGHSSKDAKNSKEVLIIFGALFTSDPSDIHDTIDNLIVDEIKVKVIGLSAQVAICQELVNKTNHQQRTIVSKNYGVIMGESHFKELLMECVTPLPVSAREKGKDAAKGNGIPLIKMGFPSKIHKTSSSSVTVGKTSFVVNFPHLTASNPTEGLDAAQPAVSLSSSNNSSTGLAFGSTNTVGYQCPQCLSKVKHLPTICPVCGLMLILSTHLAPSYHHLIPLPPYSEVPVAESYESLHCYGCLLKFPKGISTLETTKSSLEYLTSSRYRCIKCDRDFCIDCDVFIHETLHNCPSCENGNRKIASGDAQALPCKD